MKIKIICIGKLKDQNIKNLIYEYEKRLINIKIDLIEIKDSNKDKETKILIETLEQIENINNINKSNNKDRNNKEKNKTKSIFLLSEEGILLNSIEFSNLIKNSIQNNIILIFVIASENGFSIELKRKYKLLSLSKMTFPHEIARLLLYEQIYRAETILLNKNYHK